jgi:para-aminobenzoate synthetase component 1
VCLTHRLDAPFDGDPFALWQELRRASPAPFAAFLDLPEGAVVSSSPERFLALDAARTAESRPIKGTRPRGATPEEDAQHAADLAASPKDRAENAMIVDLVRNDLGRVCRFGTVEAPELFVVERYATVHQLVSTVRGELDPAHDAVDLIRACFPPGSMTGAPKIEAMTLLEALEPTERGVYAGALGWMDFSGTLDLSVVIRTIVLKDGRAHVHVGGAIVADSDPPSEYDETMHKARAMLEALAACEDRPPRAEASA